MAGIVYIHRISDIRMTGTSVRNFKMFRDLCGDTTLRNVVIATNMWEQVENQNIAISRETELRETFFEPVVRMKGEIIRLYNTDQSALDLLGHITNNHPLALKIQRELVDEHKSIRQTAAGAALVAETEARMEQRLRELEESSKGKVVLDCTSLLISLAPAAMQEKDADFKKMFEDECKKFEDEINKMKEENKNLEGRYQQALDDRGNDDGPCTIF